jgi:hypothetical protein
VPADPSKNDSSFCTGANLQHPNVGKELGDNGGFQPSEMKPLTISTIVCAGTVLYYTHRITLQVVANSGTAFTDLTLAAWIDAIEALQIAANSSSDNSSINIRSIGRRMDETSTVDTVAAILISTPDNGEGSGGSSGSMLETAGDDGMNHEKYIAQFAGGCATILITMLLGSYGFCYGGERVSNSIHQGSLRKLVFSPYGALSSPTDESHHYPLVGILPVRCSLISLPDQPTARTVLPSLYQPTARSKSALMLQQCQSVALVSLAAN